MQIGNEKMNIWHYYIQGKVEVSLQLLYGGKFESLGKQATKSLEFYKQS